MILMQIIPSANKPDINYVAIVTASQAVAYKLDPLI